MAGDDGLEPPQTASEAAILPLDESPLNWFRHGDTTVDHPG
jgi:hypothetical protein